MSVPTTFAQVVGPHLDGLGVAVVAADLVLEADLLDEFLRPRADRRGLLRAGRIIAALASAASSSRRAVFNNVRNC
jgi:hypothetical protein